MKTIKIENKIWKELYQQKLDKELSKIEKVIENNILFSKNFDNELQFHKWIESNYHLLGFDSLIESNYRSFPDLVLMKDNKKIRVEVETLSRNFISHKHNPKEVDLVLCLINNVKLPIKTIEINPFTFDKFEETTHMRISLKFKAWLCSKGKHGESFERIIKRLVKYK